MQCSVSPTFQMQGVDTLFGLEITNKEMAWVYGIFGSKEAELVFTLLLEVTARRHTAMGMYKSELFLHTHRQEK